MPNETQQAAPNLKDKVTAVLNNRDSNVSIALPQVQTAQGILPGHVLQLAPGMNFVNAEHWGLAKQNKMVRDMLEQEIEGGKAEELRKQRTGRIMLEEGPTVSKDNPLKDVTVDAHAIALVNEMINIPALKNLADEEARPNVQAAIQTRIKTLLKPDQKKKA